MEEEEAIEIGGEPVEEAVRKLCVERKDAA